MMAAESLTIDSLNSLMKWIAFSLEISDVETDRAANEILRVLIEGFSGFEDAKCSTRPWNEVHIYSLITYGTS